MAIESKRMQQRSGTYEQFLAHKSEFLPNEFGIVTSGDPSTSDGKAVYIATGIGEVKRLPFSDEINQGGGGGSVEIPVVAHGTSDTTIELPAGEYHTWDEVASLAITLKAAENSGIVNEYMFCFTSGATATTLSLPESVKTDIVVEPNTRYECSIVGDYMVFNDWSVDNA